MTISTISSDPRVSASVSRPVITGAVRPEKWDLIVATYGSFAALVRRTGLAPGTAIKDEIHLVEDDT
jgi:hypothetical protein